MNSAVVQQIVDQLRVHSFPVGLAQVSSLAMLMVPHAALHHMDSHGTPPSTPQPIAVGTSDRDKKRRDKHKKKRAASAKPAKKENLKASKKKFKSLKSK